MTDISSSKKLKVLAIDPGDMTGWCYIESPDTIFGYGNLKYADLIKFIGDWDYDKRPIDVVLAEDYIIFDKRRVRFGDRQKTTRALGALEVACRIKKIKFITRDSSILPTAVKRTGINPYKGAHSGTHWVFAYLHAAYFFVTLNLRKSALQQSKELK